jgi:hypothetical protein
MDFILENKDFFYKRYTPREPKDGVDALDSVDLAINSFDHLRKLPIIKTDKKNLIPNCYDYINKIIFKFSY